jgi:hypothetical protein
MLMWLHQNNLIFADIIIAKTWLDKLPEDDIPEELLSVIREGEDEDLLVTEQDLCLNVNVNSQHMKVVEDQTESEIGGK